MNYQKFRDIISKLANRFVMFSKNVDKVTVVFDKGNNSKDNMKLLDDTPYRFVGSLKSYDYKHFLEIPLEKFPLVPTENGEEDKKTDDIYAYRTREEVLGAERTVVVTYEQKLYNRNLIAFVKGIEKRKKEFEELKSFGKTILFTDNHEWITAQIIRVNKGLSG